MATAARARARSRPPPARWGRICTVGLPLALLACPGAEPGTDAGAPGVTGAACAVDADCAPPQHCERQAPGGYCTRACTPCPEACLAAPDTCPEDCLGPDEPLCPNGGRCAHVVFGASGVAVDRCLARCDDDGAPCRPGYQCLRAAGSELGLCLP